MSEKPLNNSKLGTKKKYKNEAHLPAKIKGSSAGLPPMYPKKKKTATKNQKLNFRKGEKRLLFICMLKAIKGKIKKIRMAANIATTPPSLSGIARKIA